MTGNLGNMSKTTKITKGSDKILKENRVNGGFFLPRFDGC
jgi:hypothetical protein